MSPPTPKIRWCATLLTLAASGCRYDPKVPEGIAECRTDRDCPAGYECRPKTSTAQVSVCCKSAGCGFTPPDQLDGGAPPLLDATPAPDLAGNLGLDTGALGGAGGDTGALDGAAADGSRDVPDQEASTLLPDAMTDVPAPSPDVLPDTALDTAPPCPPASAGPELVRAGSYCIDSTEVTNEQYLAFLSAKAGNTTGQGNGCRWTKTSRS
jgi:hypothetical protein